TLRPGQPVYIPPLEILQKRYPALIPEPTAVPVPGVGVAPTAPVPGFGAPPVGSAAVPPIGGAAVPPVGSVPSTAHPRPITPVGERQYTVQERPETFYEIAKRLLGDGNRWSDLWRLNPSFASNASLPVGTVVRVPVQ